MQVLGVGHAHRRLCTCPCVHALCVQDTIVAIRKGGDKLVVVNLESDKYPTIEFSTDPNQVRLSQARLGQLALLATCIDTASIVSPGSSSSSRWMGSVVLMSLPTMEWCGAPAGGGHRQAHVGQLFPCSIQGESPVNPHSSHCSSAAAPVTRARSC
jgi:hypothetical protein